MLMRQVTLGLVAVALLAGANFAAAEETKSNGKDIVTTAVEAGSFETLAAALTAADLVETLQGSGPFTVFAPTDEAFANLPEGTVAHLLEPANKAQLIALLTYHVVPGKVMAADVVKLRAAGSVNGQRLDIQAGSEGVLIDQARVVSTDIRCSNGVIHVIDQVLLPSEKNIPATAASAGTFKTLLAAAEAAGLVDALSADGPLTVFAPTDEAFAKLPRDTIANLLKPENKHQLIAILKYHVVAGRNFSSDLLDAKSATSLQGGELDVSVTKGGATVEGAKLLTTDIDASNGVIHVIDTVLLPKTPVKGSCEGTITSSFATCQLRLPAEWSRGDASPSLGYDETDCSSNSPLFNAPSPYREGALSIQNAWSYGNHASHSHSGSDRHDRKLPCATIGGQRESSSAGWSIGGQVGEIGCYPSAAMAGHESGAIRFAGVRFKAGFRRTWHAGCSGMLRRLNSFEARAYHDRRRISGSGRHESVYRIRDGSGRCPTASPARGFDYPVCVCCC